MKCWHHQKGQATIGCIWWELRRAVFLPKLSLLTGEMCKHGFRLVSKSTGRCWHLLRTRKQRVLKGSGTKDSFTVELGSCKTPQAHRMPAWQQCRRVASVPVGPQWDPGGTLRPRLPGTCLLLAVHGVLSTSLSVRGFGKAPESLQLQV